MSIYGPIGVPTEKVHAVLSELEHRLSSGKEHPGRFRDSVVAQGENLNCVLFAEYLKAIGIRAEYISPKDAGLLVTPVFGDAQPLPDSSMKMALLKKHCAEQVVVFPGFFGYTAQGDIATFSRGGSDLTGAIVAEAIDASEYENWTDVDGIFSAHPHMVENPEQIPALTYKEMRELSYIGFNVLHEEAVPAR